MRQHIICLNLGIRLVTSVRSAALKRRCARRCRRIHAYHRVQASL